MAAPLVLMCNAADFNATTGECAAPFYSYSATLLPHLSVADAQVLLTRIAILFVMAWGWKFLSRNVRW